MINETFAYPKLNQNIEWKYLGGTWLSSFYNENSKLVVFYDENIDDIEVKCNGITLNSVVIHELSSIENRKAYVYNNAFGNIILKLKNVNVKSLSINGFSQLYLNIIDSDLYRKVSIHGKVWTVQNIDIVDSELHLGSPYSEEYARANYYDNSEKTYSLHGELKCGLLYNFKAVEYLQQNRESLFKGWHVPTLDEWLELLESSNIVNFMAKAHSITNEFPNSTYWDGNDTKGFSMLPSGKREGNDYKEIGSHAYFWTSTANKCIMVTKNSENYEFNVLNSSESNQCAIRLIKDY